MYGQTATYDEDNDSIYDAFMLDQVVVTSSKSEVKRRNSPALVNVMPSTLLTTVGACSLADGLSFQPGVRVENDCQNAASRRCASTVSTAITHRY